MGLLLYAMHRTSWVSWVILVTDTDSRVPNALRPQITLEPPPILVPERDLDGLSRWIGFGSIALPS
jgi:hypothetical protein